jgi:hypothetical protein
MVYCQPSMDKTLYELWKEKKQMVKHFHEFGSKCYILHDIENLENFDFKSDGGIFLGYSHTSQAFCVYNKRTKTMMKSINVIIDDDTINVKGDVMKSSKGAIKDIVEVQSKNSNNEESLSRILKVLLKEPIS